MPGGGGGMPGGGAGMPGGGGGNERPLIVVVVLSKMAAASKAARAFVTRNSTICL